MRRPVNPNFERMRVEAERQRLEALEAQSIALTEMLKAQAEAARKDNDALRAENLALRQTVDEQAKSGGAKTADLEERYQALGAQLGERLVVEQRHNADLDALNASLKSQAETERATAAALEARCEALTEQLASHAETDAEALSKLEDLREKLVSEAEAANKKALALEAELGSLAGRVEEVDESLSQPERLRRAIAPVLSGALRDAGVEDHDPMASAIAPYIIQTIKSELLNSQDELVEAIHPRMGALIAAAVTNAVAELNEKVDNALPIDRWMASAKGRLTGSPSAGWLLEDGNTFTVKEAMLIERQSGILLASERNAMISGVENPDEDLMAGMIAALQGFASEAYGATGAGDLRRFSFTEDTVYLRGTPTKLLALRCSGVAPPAIESRVDHLLETALERLRDDDDLTGGMQMLDDFNAPFDVANDEGPSASTIIGRALAGVAALVALVWGHGAVTDAHESRWLTSVEEAVEGDRRLSPYPLSVTREENGGSFVVSGLLPDEAALTALSERIDWSGSPIPVTLDVALVTGEPE